MRCKLFILLSFIGLMLLICCLSQAARTEKHKTASETETPSFVVPLTPSAHQADNTDAALQPPILHDQQAETTTPLNFDTESEEHPLGRGTPGFALLMGGAFLHTGSGWDAAPTLAARYYFPNSFTETEGPESLSPWSVELGAILPHAMSGDAGGSITRMVGNTIDF